MELSINFSGAAPADASDWQSGLANLKSLCVEIAYAPVGAGVTAAVTLETRIGAAGTPIEVLRAALGSAAVSRVAVLVPGALAPVAPGTLADDSVRGFFGDQWRLRLVGTGVFAAGSAVTARLNPAV